MKHFEWKLTRQLVEKPAAQQRWDQVYQLLLDWSKPSVSTTSLLALTQPAPVETHKIHFTNGEEAPINESSRLCAGFKPSSGPNPNH